MQALSDLPSHVSVMLYLLEYNNFNEGETMYTFKRSSGFTLMELMVAVAIMGILAGIAYPSYTEYVTRSKRADAKAALLQVQIAQEKYRANCEQYADGIDATTMSCLAGGIGTHNLVGSTTSPDGYYTIAIAAGANATTYTVTAAPQAPFTDATCGTFAVNQNGKTTLTTPGSVQTTVAKVNECWGK